MSVIDGFDDLKAKDVIAFDHSGGCVTVIYNAGGKLRQRKLQISPTGALTTAEIEPVPIDQQGAPKRTPVSQRWATTDQGSAVAT